MNYFYDELGKVLYIKYFIIAFAYLKVFVSLIRGEAL